MDGVLTTPAPAATPRDAEAILMLHFGIEGRASPLPGERDRNFRIIATTGDEYLLKLINPAEDPAVTHFHDGALRHMAANDPDLAVPRLIAPRSGGDGATTASGLRVRLTTFLAGRPLAASAASASLRIELGALLARVDRALEGYDRQGERGDLLWDLGNAGRLRELLAAVEDGGRRARLEGVLDRFDASVGPALSALPRQAIHNDFNPSNVLVDAEGVPCGVIDFGDVVSAPRVQDLAVAAAYQIPEEGGLLTPMLDLVEGYAAIAPLDPSEAGILLDLLELRVAMTAIISAWRTRLDPANRDYIMRHAAAAWGRLEALGALDREWAGETLRRRTTAHRITSSP
jgi:Ser/Thr protein kinase RdoA (MazF antagonist)